MNQASQYKASLTSQQFMFREMRIVSPYYLADKPVEDVIKLVTSDNLFQFPTERKINDFVYSCYKRLGALRNEVLVQALAQAPVEIARQINLYALMRENRLVREFMIHVIGDKYVRQDFSYSKKDLNIFIARIQEQDDHVASWRDSTVQKIKQVLTKCLVEVEILDSTKSTTLNTILISEVLEKGIRENDDLPALVAFNCLN